MVDNIRLNQLRARRAKKEAVCVIGRGISFIFPATFSLMRTQNTSVNWPNVLGLVRARVWLLRNFLLIANVVWLVVLTGSCLALESLLSGVTDWRTHWHSLSCWAAAVAVRSALPGAVLIPSCHQTDSNSQHDDLLLLPVVLLSQS